jgi:GNAT superfamily N-acetyltransferase
MNMSKNVRSADLVADRPLIADLLCRNLGRSAAGQRFDWLYTKSPHGQARVWLAVEPETGEGMGVASAFPRKLCVDGTIRLGYVLGDFCIDQRHRSLGLALRLQRACLEQLLSTGNLLSYDFPSDRMMAVYRRMGLVPAGQIVRWAKPLRVHRQIVKLIKRPALVRIVAASLNWLLEWQDRAFRSSRRWDIDEHPVRCQEEFTQLARQVGSRYGTCVYRSAEHLNWRYFRHPSVRYEFLTARHGGKLMGYVVFSQTEQDAAIVDWFGLDDPTMWNSLMAHIVLRLRARQVVTISAPALANSPLSGLLDKWGFRRREQ